MCGSRLINAPTLVCRSAIQEQQVAEEATRRFQLQAQGTPKAPQQAGPRSRHHALRTLKGKAISKGRRRPQRSSASWRSRATGTSAASPSTATSTWTGAACRATTCRTSTISTWVKKLKPYVSWHTPKIAPDVLQKIKALNDFKALNK